MMLVSALGRRKCDVVSTLGSNFNCYTALGKSHSVAPTVTLIKEGPGLKLKWNKVIKGSIHITYLFFSFRYNYICCVLKKQTKQICYDTSTCFDDDGKGDSRYLDRQYVGCSAGYFITQFKLVRQPPDQYRYNYKCCTQA